MKRKSLIVMCALFACIIMLSLLTACDTKLNSDKDNSSIKILALGDSIAEGILGPSPINERENYSYLNVIGQINGFTYRNRAISGHQSRQLLNYISKDEDETAYATITHLKTADIIVISILGNDLLQNSFSNFIIPALREDFSQIDAILEKSYNNLDKIVKRINFLNPDATLIFQTVYNPMFDGSTLINENVTKKLKEVYGFTAKEMYDVGGLMLNRLNHVFYEYLKNNPNKFVIADVNAKFDALYREDNSRLDRLIYNDCIHPSSEGHAVITSVIQEKLEDLGLAEHEYAINNYKELRCRQLGNLYSGTSVNIRKTKLAIKSAKTYNKINEIYFDAIEGVLPNAKKIQTIEKSKNETYMQEKMEFAATDITVLGREFTWIFDMETTKAILNPDGTFEIRIEVRDSIMELLITLLEGLTYVDFLDFLQPYIDELFPGESALDIVKTIRRLKNDVGLTIEGVNPENKLIKKILDTLKETGELPEEIKLPKNMKLAAVLRGRYSVHDDESENGEGRKAIYVGNYTPNGDTFLILTYYENNENNKEGLRIKNEMINLDLYFEK